MIETIIILTTMKKMNELVTPKGTPELAGRITRVEQDYNGEPLYILDNGARYTEEELGNVLLEQKKMKIDGVVVYFSKSGNRIFEIPQGMSGDSFSEWITKNKETLEKEFPDTREFSV